MKKIKWMLFVFVLLAGTSGFAETFEDWPPYKDYLKVKHKYRSTTFEKMLRDSYVAEKKVRSLPCSKGGTLDEYFSKNLKSPADDLGWNEFEVDNGYDVVRTIIINPYKSLATLKYKWHVDPSGKVTPLNSEAISITSQQYQAVPYTLPAPPKPLYSIDTKDKMSSEKIERLLCGAWTMLDAKITYYPDGTYTEKGASYKLDGEWRVEDGNLYHTGDKPLRMQIVEIGKKNAVFRDDDGKAFTGVRGH